MTYSSAHAIRSVAHVVGSTFALIRGCWLVDFVTNLCIQGYIGTVRYWDLISGQDDVCIAAILFLSPDLVRKESQPKTFGTRAKQSFPKGVI